jgi:sec-independent protein translocase protein TatC
LSEEEKPASGSHASVESLYERKKVMRRVEPDDKLPFTAHLEELRWRLIHCLIAVGVVFIGVYAVSDHVLEIIRKPLGMELVYLGPAEGFFMYMKLSFYVAVMIAMPILLYHAWEFVAPGLLEGERRFTGLFVTFGVIFFAMGSAFCYFVVLPVGLKFLMSYGGEGLKPMISVGNYISFVFMFVIAFGLIFEMPLVIVFLAKMGLVTPEWLAKQRSYFVVGDFIVAAVLTPTPDVLSQLMMAVPMMILFEVGLLASRFIAPKKTGQEDAK